MSETHTKESFDWKFISLLEEIPLQEVDGTICTCRVTGDHNSFSWFLASISKVIHRSRGILLGGCSWRWWLVTGIQERVWWRRHEEQSLNTWINERETLLSFSLSDSCGHLWPFFALALFLLPFLLREFIHKNTGFLFWGSLDIEILLVIIS